MIVLVAPVAPLFARSSECVHHLELEMDPDSGDFYSSNDPFPTTRRTFVRHLVTSGFSSLARHRLFESIFYHYPRYGQTVSSFFGFELRSLMES